MRELHYETPSDFDPGAVVARLETSGLTGAVEAPRTICRVFYDADDHRLHEHGFSLWLDAGEVDRRLVLADRVSPLVLASAIVNRPPRLAGGLPEGRLWREAARVLGDAVLEPCLRLSVEQRAIRIRDERGKGVAGLLFETVQPISIRPGVRAGGPRLRLLPVRGYPTCFARLAEWLEGEGMRPWRSVDDGLSGFPVREEGEARPRPAAIDVELTASEPAVRVLRRCLRWLHRRFCAEERAVSIGRGGRHLHDLRVTVRMARSLLKTFRRELAGESFDLLREDLAWLAAVTGPPRDLDVQCAGLRRLVDDRLSVEAPALAPLFDWLDECRLQAHGRLREAMASDRFRRLKGRWRILSDETLPVAEAGATPVDEAARRGILRSSRNLSRRLDRARRCRTSADRHALRKEAKRLRYQLVSLRGLFPRRRLRRVLRSLERLQDLLGRCQDLAVRRDLLRRFLHSLEDGGAGRPELLDAIGRLERILADERRRARRAADACLTTTARRRLRRRLRRLARAAVRGR